MKDFKIENSISSKEIKTEIQNNQYLNLSEEQMNNKTILIKSAPGTGKTTQISKHMKRIQEDNPDVKFISIVNLISLANQHLKSFKDIGLKSYQDITDDEFKSNNFVICINSLYRLDEFGDDDFKNYVVYIDEINSFLQSLTHNDKLTKNIKLIYIILAKMIKNCKKLILSDAIINNNVLNFIKSRSLKKTLYIENQVQKYKNINAINQQNEVEFIQKIQDNILEKKYFLFGSDSCAKITEFFHYFTSLNPDLKKDFILITSDTGYKVKDAQIEFKNKFVFYSPSITTGVDFSIDTKQNVFMYLNQNSISPDGFFQQTTRTRNINKLYYFIEDKDNLSPFENIKDVEKHYKKVINAGDKLSNISINLNEEDEPTINENKFFKLYCFNEFQKIIYNTNKKHFFEQLLIENGFILSVEGVQEKLDKVKVKKMKEAVKEEKDILLNEYIEASEKERDDTKYSNINNNLTLLNITNDEDIKNYSFIIQNEFLIRNYFNVLTLFKTKLYIFNKLKSLNVSSYKIKYFDSIYNKVNLIRNLETKYNIKPFDLTFTDILYCDMTDEEFLVYKQVFRSEKNKPKDIKDIKLFYIQFINNICGEIDIISNITIRKDKKRIKEFKMNEAEIQKIFELAKFNVESFKNFDEDLLKLFNIGIPKEEEEDQKLDIGNGYLFGLKK